MKSRKLVFLKAKWWAVKNQKQNQERDETKNYEKLDNKNRIEQERELLRLSRNCC